MPIVGSCGSEDLANELLTVLVGDKQFTPPALDLTDPNFQIPTTPPGIGDVNKLDNADLTEGKIDGDGTFDAIMSGISAHLKGEFEKGRITGEQYSKVYIALTEAALGNAVQYLLGRDAAYWQTITAQLQAQVAQAAVVESRVNLEIAKHKLQMLRYEMLTAEVTFALGKLKLSSESIQYCTAKYQLEQILPEQRLMTIAQRKTAEEALETARAQTLDTRTDGTVVVGVIGKQKDLYSQQIISYKRDAETKVMKIFSDARITIRPSMRVCCRRLHLPM